MSVTASSLILDALTQLGKAAPGESLSKADGELGLSRLNDWIDSHGIERLTMSYTLRTVKALTAGTASYTIGSGGDVNIQRPQYLERAGVLLDNTATDPDEARIEVLPEQGYAEWRIKTLSGTPSAVYYDHNWASGLGRVYPLPIPDVSTTSLVLYTPQAATQFADLTTVYTFPPAYRRFYRLGLARELRADYGIPPSADLEQMFAEAQAAVKRANLRPIELHLDPALTRRGWYRGESDTYRRY